MTHQRPPRCHYDRATRTRYVDHQHDPECAGDCDGCEPCPHRHCGLCRTRHATDTHPHVCAECVGGVRDDLQAITGHQPGLRAHALLGGQAGRLNAAAPIPGGTAMVLIGPAGDREAAANRIDSHLAGRKSHRLAEFAEAHRPGDPEPILGRLRVWVQAWQRDLGIPEAAPTSVSDAVTRLDLNLTLMSQRTGVDFARFADDVAAIRTAIESVLHDEDERTAGNRGVECFECGVRLIRRIRPSKPCSCGPRPVLKHAEHAPCTCPVGVRLERTTNPDGTTALQTITTRSWTPGDGHVHPPALWSCVACHREATWDRTHARHRQGGVDDPTPGLSWECPGCRKKYSPGEYATAVRRDLLDRGPTSGLGGWASLPVAAEAAAELTGRPVTAKTIRTWVQRAWDRQVDCGHETPARDWLLVLASYPELGRPTSRELAAGAMPCRACADPVLGLACTWEEGARFGVQVVFWPDVADRIASTRRPGRPSRVAS